MKKEPRDVDPEIQEEYKTFLRHLMSLCRKYEYELLPEMQEKVMTAALAAAGLTAETEHTQVKIGFTCPKETSDLNLFVNMTKLNGIQIDAMNLMTENGNQKVTMTLDGKITDAGMRCLLCQIGKEAEEFRILELIWDLIQKGMTTRTCIKSRKPFLFRFRRWEILKRQNYAKNGLPKFATRHSAQTGKFRKPNA